MNQTTLEKNYDVAVLQAIRKGILELVGDSGHFNCTLCSKDISGADQALQHIQGKPHKKREDTNTGNNVAVRNITTDSYQAATPSSAFVVAYEDNVRIALQEKIIREKDKQRFLFFCNACQSDVSGGIGAHLDGRDHINSGICWVIKNPENFPPSLKRHVPDIVFEAARRGKVDILPSPKNAFRCVECNKNVTGISPLNSHLESHQTNAGKFTFALEPRVQENRMDVMIRATEMTTADDELKTALQEQIITEKNKQRFLYFCNMCYNEVSGGILAHLVGRDHINSSICWVINNPRKFPPSLKRHVPSRVLDAALHNKVEVLASPKNAFRCLECYKIIAGISPLNSHLECHLEKTTSVYGMATAPAATNRNVEIIKSRPTSYSSSRNTDNDGCLPQMDVNVTDLARKLMENLTVSKNEIYIVRSKPPGFVLVFNYIFKNEPKAFREGASADSEAIKLAFQKLKYRVEVYEDKTKDETLKIVEDLKNGEILKKVDSFICVILSHGKRNMKFHTIGSNLMDLDELRHLFKNSSCPNLVGKPKIFFANFCRGLDSERDLRSDSMDEVEYDSITDAPTDMVTFHASINNFKARRSPIAGTIFIKSLCNTLNSSSSLDLMVEFRRNFYKEMEKNGGSTPEVQDYKFVKKFYFKP